MTTQCPRCGAPRGADGVFCHQCGLDFRAAGGPSMPAQQALPPQQSLYGTPPPPTGYQQSGWVAPQPPGWVAPQQAPGWGPPPQRQGWGAPPPPAPWQPVQTPPAAWTPAPAAPPAGAPPDGSADPSAAADPSQPTAVAMPPQPVSAPSVCLRCYSPLHPGYARCGNCGFDNSSAFAAAPLAPAGQIPLLAVALALLGAGLLIAAAALVFVAQRAG